MTSGTPQASTDHEKMTCEAESSTTHEHDAVTLALAEKESKQHLKGVDELYKSMRQRDLLIQAYTCSNSTSEAPVPSCFNGANGSNAKVKVVHFLRHGQGFHNLMADMYVARGAEWEQFVHSSTNPYVLPEITDAPLTQKGRQQARAVQPLIQNMETQPQLVVLSSNCRALQTGLIAFAHLLEPDLNVPFMAHELVREETGVHVCDRRRRKSEQQAEFPQVNFNFVESEEDLLFLTDRRENKMEIGNRIYNFMEWLEEREETHIAVASHSGWLQTAFNGVFECEESLKKWFQTGELRSVKLEFMRKGGD